MSPGPSSPSDCVPPTSAAQEQEEATGVPFFHTWRSVYLFALGSFVLWVLLLILLTLSYR